MNNKKAIIIIVIFVIALLGFGYGFLFRADWKHHFYKSYDSVTSEGTKSWIPEELKLAQDIDIIYNLDTNYYKGSVTYSEEIEKIIKERTIDSCGLNKDGIYGIKVDSTCYWIDKQTKLILFEKEK